MTARVSAHGATRRAVPADAEALVALRVLLMRAMGEPDADEPGWQDSARSWFARELAGDEAVAFVVDAPGTPGGVTSSVVACALVTLHHDAPSARNPHGTTAHLTNVCTVESARGRGYARACVDAALDWARAAGADSVSLHATPDGERLYRSLGFDDTRYTELRLRW